MDGSRALTDAAPGAAGSDALPEDDGALLELLARQGFPDPEAWVDRARELRFRRVPARRLAACPHCGREGSPVLGTYVYYSNFARLCGCPGCGLWYSDLRLDPATVQAHFEDHYKDERYFVAARERIFEQVAAWVARSAPPAARVLDVGGAKGHLLAKVRERRPDLRCTLHDLSLRACEHARRVYGFETLSGSMADLAARGGAFEVLVLSDVIYYEPDLASVWAALDRLLVPGGHVLIRVPDKAAWIRRGLRRQGAEARAAGAGVPHFNPEHLYVFTRAFLARELARAGFEDVRIQPSRLLGGGAREAAAFAACRLAGAVLRRPVTPAVLVTARKGRRAPGADAA